MLNKTRKRLGDLLLEVEMITTNQLESAIEVQKKTGEKLGTILTKLGYVNEDDIIQVLEFQLGIPHVKLEKYNIDKSAYLAIPESIARRYGLIPIKKDKGTLTVAMSDPLNVFAIDDLNIYSGMEIQPVIASFDDISRAIDKYYSAQKAMKAVEEFKKEQVSTIKINSDTAEEQNIEEINNAPAVKVINSIIEQAVRSRASDIHIEPFEEYIKIRFRTDGQLCEIMRPEIDIMPAISARIKIIGGMNIAEKRLPQDGRISIEVDGREYDLRVSILPTIFGEKIVIRIADKKAFVLSKSQLGFSEYEEKQFQKMLLNPHGIILVTGPTGSGKTTTLYSAISEINSSDINIITVEDPVECVIEGVNHVQVNAKTGLTFASGLRSILRQDPDVIMIGEIRDIETAEIAVRAAITGHLVLSTLHTNDAPSSVLRLIDMGVEHYMVSSSIVGVIAQRLYKKICSNCKMDYSANDYEKRIVGINDEELILYKGRGCPMCNHTGYRGRHGVYELISITKKHKEMINNKCSEEEFRNYSIQNGMVTLRDNLVKKVLAGDTTIDELVRIAYSND
ncbi:type II secretion system protein E [Ruminiclostridium papyrosolvens DSM 2782]|uniref:Type II secretion system protein E n=1 Tax=Ruminiclostridium papyrosolvens DSM 2782 TaxID=588581 RepID=F1TIL9_9FIRM|nr:GspE/PulE family protein [Ruminiclostridium papyrosolvens]EGD45718.1 type II secretion system protein E [Ruminiclostridium papyrosolvens DSM 2782]WES35305.1 ATPase, T2SS/T4P/T4SS family [Ruminiclostridium papyrosolvens DSM 2782]